jgi:hypothetical protein
LKVLNLTRIIDSQLPVANEEFQTVSVENWRKSWNPVELQK